MPLPAILILDIGKTNKKMLLFDDRYKLLREECTQLRETVDEDGFPCEDLNELTRWTEQKFSEILSNKDFEIKAINFSAYGASFVHLNKELKPVTPLYNYLKPFPENLKKQFYSQYGGESLIAKQTASPVLGSLNSGMQLYRLKYEKPGVYDLIKYSLHLPQYISCIISKKPATDISSVGCHTNLWDFGKGQYHDWVFKEQLDRKLAPVYKGDKTFGTAYGNNGLQSGIGLHDSSAALIPYLFSFHEPFILISTGTWCISLNPFNHAELTNDELRQDCLCYLSYEGKPVKASRLFAGYEHEQQVKRIAAHFNKGVISFQAVRYNPESVDKAQRIGKIKQIPFSEIDLTEFKTYEDAYHRLMYGIIRQQIKSTNLVLQGTTVKRIFVDGGFGKNPIYMQLLAKNLPGIEVYSAMIPQASALGAALAIHKSWNKHPVPSDLIELKYYANTETNYSI
ncbi:MAG: FGGY-family carbohydrate kinase [Chitinophagales bacterium]